MFDSISTRKIQKDWINAAEFNLNKAICGLSLDDWSGFCLTFPLTEIFSLHFLNNISIIDIRKKSRVLFLQNYFRVESYNFTEMPLYENEQTTSNMVSKIKHGSVSKARKSTSNSEKKKSYKENSQIFVSASKKSYTAQFNNSHPSTNSLVSSFLKIKTQGKKGIMFGQKVIMTMEAKNWAKYVFKRLSQYDNHILIIWH